MIAVLRALVVDPSQEMRSYLSGILASDGFDCVQAGDGIAALAFASGLGVDLIVTELDMPQMDGFELIRLVRRGAFGAPHPPIIVCSSVLDDGSCHDRPELDACFELLSKPVLSAELLAAVANAFPHI